MRCGTCGREWLERTSPKHGHGGNLVSFYILRRIPGDIPVALVVAPLRPLLFGQHADIVKVWLFQHDLILAGKVLHAIHEFVSGSWQHPPVAIPLLDGVSEMETYIGEMVKLVTE